MEHVEVNGDSLGYHLNEVLGQGGGVLVTREVLLIPVVKPP